MPEWFTLLKSNLGEPIEAPDTSDFVCLIYNVCAGAQSRSR